MFVFVCLSVLIQFFCVFFCLIHPPGLQTSPDVFHLCLIGSAPFLLYLRCVELQVRAFAGWVLCAGRLNEHWLSFRLNLKIPFG